MRTLLLDFDGTLFDTDSAHERAFRAVFENVQMVKMPSYEQIKGMKTIDVFKKYFEADEAALLAVEKGRKYMEWIVSVQPIVDLSLLKRCAQSEISLYIVSGGRRASITALLDIYGVSELFKGIVSSEDYCESKPSPDSFLTCMNRFGITGNVIGVEDSAAGIESLKRAKIRAVGVNNPEIREISPLFYNSINQFLEDYLDDDSF